MPAIIAGPPRRQVTAAMRTVAPIVVVPGSRPLTGAAVNISAPPFAGFGWAYIADSQYTAAEPLAIAAGQTAEISIDGLGAATDASYLRAPFAGWSFWHGGKFWPYSVGDDYTLRLDFTAQSLAINNGVRTALDIGSAAGPVYDNVEPFGVGAGVERNFRLSIDVFDKMTFETNGATITVTPAAPMTIWSVGLKISPRSVGTPR